RTVCVDASRFCGQGTFALPDIGPSLVDEGVDRPRSRRVSRSRAARARVKWNRIATGSIVVRWFERRVIRTSTCGALKPYWNVSEQETASSLHPSMSIDVDRGRLRSIEVD